MLEGAADSRVCKSDGDGAEGACVELRMSLHNIEGALRREGVIVLADAVDDFALFCVGVGGNGEAWTCGGRNRLGGR